MTADDYIAIAKKYGITYYQLYADTEICYMMPGTNWYMAKYYTDRKEMRNAVTFHYDDRAKRIIPDQWNSYERTISPTDFEKKVQNMLVALKTEENNEELKKIGEDFV